LLDREGDTFSTVQDHRTSFALTCFMRQLKLLTGYGWGLSDSPTVFTICFIYFLFIYLLIYLITYLYTYLFIYLLTYLLIYLFIYLFACFLRYKVYSYPVKQRKLYSAKRRENNRRFPPKIVNFCFWRPHYTPPHSLTHLSYSAASVGHPIPLSAANRFSRFKLSVCNPSYL
jgi:hypothetical protein